LRISERIAIRYSDVVIADNKGISDYVRKTYGKEPIVIAYGAEPGHVTSNHLLVKYNLIARSYFFKVARIEPENNLEIILEAFSFTPDQKLVVVGNWAASKYGLKLRRRFVNFLNIILLDPIYNIEELNELRQNCYVYVHGHSAGGTNPSLVEAMALNLPIFSFDVNFNRYTLDNRGFYFYSVNDLISLVNKVSQLDLIGESKFIFNVFNSHYLKSKIANDYMLIFSNNGNA